MTGLKPSVNLFALLDRNDPGDKLVTDFDDTNAKQEATAAKHKKKPTPAADHKDLLSQAYPSARDYVIRKQQRERQARAKAKAEEEARAKAKAKASNGVSGDDKSRGTSTDSGKVQDAAKQGRYYNNNNYNEASRNQQFGMSGRFGAPKRHGGINNNNNEAAPAEDVEAPPAPQQPPPPPPPSLDDISEFPSLK
ncbi:hypothetical protein ZWY2020_055736 [Hordeum vulgare]|uniref:Uncharacterized protein n=1 Tax=Hordeum vulgare subsp. vulgare TaxID=112509 RepID=A0A8I6X5G4_HORVV|nr:hypothetical protein ZWY2020_055736 [Hordeum vulgare]